MRHKNAYNTKKCLAIVMVLVICGFVGLFLNQMIVNSSGGIAISGSFSRYHYKIVPGEAISSPHVDILVFNNYNEEIMVKFSAELPDGVSVDLEGQEYKLPAKGRKSFPVSVSVEDTVVPGDYVIRVSADAFPTSERTGISIMGAAQLATKLSVYGEAAWVNIRALNPKGERFNAGQIHLFHKEGNKLSAVRNQRGGQMRERVIPGEYVAQVVYGRHTVGEKTFILEDEDDKRIDIIVQTVFVRGFSVTPQYHDEALTRLASARIDYTIENVYQPIKDATVYLRVYQRPERGWFSRIFRRGSDDEEIEFNEDDFLEEVEMYSIPTLEVVSQSGRYTYVPPDGWESGTYGFKLMLYGEDGSEEEKARGVYGESDMEKLDVEVDEGAGLGVWLVLLITIIIIALLVKRRMEEKEEEKRELEILQKEGFRVGDIEEGAIEEEEEIDGKEQEQEQEQEIEQTTEAESEIVPEEEVESEPKSEIKKEDSASKDDKEPESEEKQIDEDVKADEKE